MRRFVMQSTVGAAFLAALVLAFGTASASAAPAAGKTGQGCPVLQIRVSTGCVSRAAAQKHVEAMIRAAMPEMGLRSTIVQVDTSGTPLVDAGFGNSMKGVPASPRMYFRIGSIAIPYLIDILLQLRDEGKLSLDDKLSKYRPNFPEAEEITLRMLASVTSGYPDFIQENEAFQQLLFENPFRQWSANELIHWAFTLPIPCKPGTCYHYAHTNFAILSQVIAKVSGESVDQLMHERILKPLGLTHTAVTRYPAFPGAGLHAYTGERGIYEDCTFWSPSWSIGAGTVLTSTMGDAVRGFTAMAKGDLISKQANKERLSPANTAHLKPFNSNLYYGLGVTYANGWQLQNPFIDGYTGTAAYLPAQELSVGIVTTQLPQSANSGTVFATELLARLSFYLSPEHKIEFPNAKFAP
jgi:CubicO group peptidase (beta-lactamase class C family)